MSHKEMCAKWVKEHLFESDDDIWFITDEPFGDPVHGPYTEDEAIEKAWELTLGEDFT